MPVHMARAELSLKAPQPASCTATPRWAQAAGCIADAPTLQFRNVPSGSGFALHCLQHRGQRTLLQQQDMKQFVSFMFSKQYCLA